MVWCRDDDGFPTPREHASLDLRLCWVEVIAVTVHADGPHESPTPAGHGVHEHLTGLALDPIDHLDDVRAGEVVGVGPATDVGALRSLEVDAEARMVVLPVAVALVNLNDLHGVHAAILPSLEPTHIGNTGRFGP